MKLNDLNIILYMKVCLKNIYITVVENHILQK